jgi:hypothetical protein
MTTNLYINQGADWFDSLDFANDDNTPLNITGYTFESAFRTSYYTANTSGNLTVTIVNSVAGNTILSMNAATSANVAAGVYVYDVVMIDTFGITTRVLQGQLTIKPGVTIT